MSARAKIKSYLKCCGQDDILIEPEIFDDAILGIAELPGGGTAVVYDRQQCIEIIMADSGCTREEAEDYYERNCFDHPYIFCDTRYAE